MPVYDPWQDLHDNWPEVQVVLAPLPGRLLGELRYPLIRLRAASSAAQRRCTLTHELLHLERGVRECGPWAAREERIIEAETARRLLPLQSLIAALRWLGAEDHGAVAAALDVDTQILRARLDGLSSQEHWAVRAALCGDLWTVA
jgi:hypothetical protein